MKNVEDIYPLSPIQEGMLFHTLYTPDASTYQIQIHGTLKGEIDRAAFEQAWQFAVDQYPSLRTVFVWQNLKRPLQVVRQHVQLRIRFLDWRERSADDQATSLQALLNEDRQQHFDLTHAPLMRLVLIQFDNDTYEFIWNFHHILLDGWSIFLVLAAVDRAYAALCRGKTPELQPSPPFRDYILWLQQQSGEQAETFWKTFLQGYTVPTRLPLERTHQISSEQHISHAEAHIQLSATTTSALHEQARWHHLTLNTLIQGLWAILLSRYSGESDLVFGATVAGRPPELPDVASMVGIFINTLPIRVQITPQALFFTWLQHLQARQSEANHFAYSSLVDIHAWSDVPSDLPLFETILVYENYPISDALHTAMDGLRITRLLNAEQTHYPLTVIVRQQEQLFIQISYDTQRFEGDSIVQLLSYLQYLLESVAAGAPLHVRDLLQLSPAERRQILYAWNATENRSADASTITELVARQASRHPEGIALIYEDRVMTYKEVEESANRLAHYLRRQGVSAETLVGICMERSCDMIVAMLATLKAGGAYVPLDPHSPEDRLAFLLEDAQIGVLLTQRRMYEHFLSYKGKRLCVDELAEMLAHESSEALEEITTGDNLVYVIYTSGSTGLPKGVQVTHRALVNHTLALRSIIGVTETDRLLHFIDFSFDASSGEIFNTLASGATLVLHPAVHELSPGELLQFCQQNAITILDLPTAMWHQLVADLSLLQPASLPLRVFMVGGESPSLEKLRLLSSLLRQDQRCLFLSSYGPTEATITTTTFTTPLAPDAVASIDSLPIGRPIANVQVFVLDQQMQPVPAGVAGELYIAGAGVARGYWMRPALTAERFVPHPFARQPGDRLYRTGDLVRFRHDGSLEFLGRIDQQIKLRGFRIELGEIEAALVRQPDIQEAIVTVYEPHPQDKRLAAYVVARPGTHLSPDALRQSLREQLPAYMVPGTVVLLDALPLTANGKVDRQALPVPDGRDGWHPAEESSYVAPRTSVEAALAQIWEELLGLPRVGVENDFFALGGHSLLAMRAISSIRERLQQTVPLRVLFETRTIAGLARAIAGTDGAQVRPEQAVQRFPRPEHLPLSFAQQRLWFLARLEPGNPFYNVPLALRLDGTLHIESLRVALQAIVQRHEILRTTFYLYEGQPYQLISADVRIEMPVLDFSTLSAGEQQERFRDFMETEIQKGIDLQKGPLLRTFLLRLSPTEHILLSILHHIVTDGWSQEIFLRELMLSYEADLTGAPAKLPSLPVQYADYALWQRQSLQSEALREHLSYWTNVLAGAPTVLDLPTDKPRPTIQRHRGQMATYVLSPALLADLQLLSQRAKCTLFVTLLSGFALLMERMSSQQDLLIGTVVSGRTTGELEALIGCFVNTLALRITLDRDADVERLLQQVHHVMLDASAHQDAPFEQVVEALQPERDRSRNPLVQVLFTLQTSAAAGAAPDAPTHLNIQPLSLENSVSKFDLALIASEGDAGLQLTLEYDSDLFIAESAQRFLRYYECFLQSMIAHPRERISRLEWLPPTDRRQLLIDWNATAVPYPSTSCIHHLFEAQVQRTPWHIALSSEDEQLSYQELDQRANQLAHYLQKRGVGPEVLVGICMERSFDLVVAVLATLKAGGAYVPLDPKYPRERLRTMLDDCRPAVLITQATSSTTLPPYEGYMLSLENEWEKVACESKQAPAGSGDAGNLAYVVYTSGSTGRPKGVMISHRGLCNVIEDQIRAFGVHTESCLLQFASFSFDASVSEIFVALLAGARLFLATSAFSLLPGSSLLHLLRDQRVTTVTLPPSALALLPQEELPHLHTLIVAGEACPVPLAQQWSRYCRFLNAYGPSEVTICATIALCETAADQLPMGRPIANTRTYVLDAHMQPVPIGVPGELYLGGVGLARGYLNRPSLTAERFVPDPFSSVAGERLYKTGDLVRYCTNGELEFIGRIDQQVKLRGFRIELGEIEAAFHYQPEVQEAAVILREDTPGEKRLAAYITLRAGYTLREAELRERLREMLPDYMLPAHITVLEALPLNPNGKVNRRALPKPGQAWRLQHMNEYIGPRDTIEWNIAQIWGQLLDLKLVGVRENFFSVGGNSLLAVRLLAALEETFGIKLPLNTLFQGNTIEYLASLVRGQEDYASSWQTLVEFYSWQKDTDKLPFFCVHPSSGDTFAYADLARFIGSDQPFYAFQSRGLDGKQAPLESIEEMAHYYISLLHGVQPQGPYLLGGWSMGGIVAYEMARQLSMQGEVVALLAMLDATIVPAIEGGDEEMTRAWFGKDIPWEQFSQLDEEAQTSYTLEYLRQIGIELPDTDIHFYRNHMRLFRINSRAVFNYTPQPYAGDLTAFRCREAAAHLPPDLAWGDFVRGALKIYEVPGNHHSMMAYPHVEELARQVRRCIDETYEKLSRYPSTDSGVFSTAPFRRIQA